MEKNSMSSAASVTSAEITMEKPPATYKGLYRFCTRGDLAILFPALAVSIASGLLIPAFTILLGDIFTSFGLFSSGSISGDKLQQQTTKYVIGIVVVGAAAWALGWAHMALWLAFGENMAKRSRQAIIKGLLEKSMTWYDSKVVDSGVSGSINKAVKYYPLLLNVNI